MANLLLFPATLFLAILPLLLILWVAYEDTNPNNIFTSLDIYPYIKTWIIILTPIWLPITYIILLMIELTITPEKLEFGPSKIAVYMLFAAPAAWAISLCLNIKTPLWVTLITIPILYCAGVFGMGFLGWAGCGFLKICH